MTTLTTIYIRSFGFKYGEPPVANLVFDMRFIKNPHYVDELRPLTGQEKPVADYILQQDASKRFLERLKEQLRDTLLGYVENGNDHQTVVIAFGCTGGKHRSVCFAIQCRAIVAELVTELSLQSRIEVEHRDIGRDGNESVRPEFGAGPTGFGGC